MIHVALIVLFNLSAAALVEAGECPHKQLVTSDKLSERAPAKAVHGVLNVMSAPVEVFTATDQEVKKKPDLIRGFGIALATAANDIIRGVWDVATFWVPGDSGKQTAVTDCGWAHIDSLAQSTGCPAIEPQKKSHPSA